MEAEAKVELQTVQRPEQLRKRPRFVVDRDAVLLLVDHGLSMPCRIIDLSLEGCRMNTTVRYPAGLGVRVELTFTVNGIVFRFGGAVRWTDGGNSVGIQFVGITPRRIGELAEVLGEVEEDLAVKAVREAAEKLAAEEQAAAAQVVEIAELVLDEGELLDEQAETLAVGGSSADLPQGVERERRAHFRHEVHTSAAIFLVHTGFNQIGSILNLSLDGCRIRTDEQFLLGIYTRVEAEFRVAGRPFRVGGVIQDIREGELVGIRFAELSESSREPLEQLIAQMREIEQVRAKGKLPEADGA
jgi:hypothetical protein